MKVECHSMLLSLLYFRLTGNIDRTRNAPDRHRRDIEWTTCGLSQRAAEVEDVTVFPDVVFAFQPLEVLGLGLFERAGACYVIKRGPPGPDEALGKIGVDLAGGEHGARPTFEVPAADL